jgi:ubiquinone/menaquinone biosynthesis C-methylase UbiE
MEGWEGWDEYAPFYDWENARTLGRRDVPFWRRLAGASHGPVLELGCGTGRITLPLAHAGIPMVGVDRSAGMLARAARRARRRRARAAVHLVRGDIRRLPFPPASFALVIAPYGILQSLVRERDLAAALDAVRRVLEPGGTFALELVADLPAWDEYSRRTTLRGRRAGGARVTLIESVRQDRRRRLTRFEQEFIERGARGVVRRRFSLVFRTLSVPQMSRRLARAGFAVSALVGDYEGGPWRREADAWIILAEMPLGTPRSEG